MRGLGLLGEDLPDRCRTLRRNVPTALVIVMLAGAALPAEAKNAKHATPAAAVKGAPPKADRGKGKPANPGRPQGAPQRGRPQTAPPAKPEAAPDEPEPAPGKGKDPEEAEATHPGKGKSAVEVPAAAAKGKSGSASAAVPATPAPAPATPPASAPAVTPSVTPAEPPAGPVSTRPQQSDAVDSPARRPRSSAGTGAGAGVVAATLPVVTPSSAAAAAPAGSPEPDSDSARDRETGGASAPSSDDSVVTRTVRDVVEVVPDELKAALALLAALAVLFGGGYLLAALRARRLGRQRRELMQEVGLLQSALLPPVPEKVGAVRASVAYRPSDGPGAGGDFYDALTLPGGRAAFILGDVSGHGRAALAHTAFMRYTLRAYLEAGLEPRLALQVAERAVGGQLDGDFATVIVAVHDPANGSLTYASAGHPAPIVAGGARHEPVLAAWSPPIGWGLPTGLRQTTVPLPSGAIACLYTDGLAEATTADGILGRARLSEIVGEAGRDATAQDVLDAVVAEAVSVRDDMAACLIAPARNVHAGAFRTELLEIGPSELHEGLAVRFLEECHVPAAAIDRARENARHVVDEYGGALMVVNFGVRGSRVEVLPRNVESLQAAALRKSAAQR